LRFLRWLFYRGFFKPGRVLVLQPFGFLMCVNVEGAQIKASLAVVVDFHKVSSANLVVVWPWIPRNLAVFELLQPLFLFSGDFWGCVFCGLCLGGLFGGLSEAWCIGGCVETVGCGCVEVARCPIFVLVWFGNSIWEALTEGWGDGPLRDVLRILQELVEGNGA
jgi:hypothetical protein